MLLSEAIAKLQAVLRKQGDIPVRVYDDEWQEFRPLQHIDVGATVKDRNPVVFVALASGVSFRETALHDLQRMVDSMPADHWQWSLDHLMRYHLEKLVAAGYRTVDEIEVLLKTRNVPKA